MQSLRVALVSSLFAITACTSHRNEAPPPAKLAEPAPLTKPERRVAERVETGYVGVLTPREAAEVTAPFASQVLEVFVKLGDHVEKGDKLARLDDRPLREELEIARAGLKSNQAQVAQASIERSAAYTRLKREKAGLKANVSSAADVAAAGFDSRKAGTQVARAAAEADEQRARISQLEQRLEESTLVAPLSGIVAVRYLEEGARVAERQAVIRVISSDELFVKFAIPAADARKVAPGDPIALQFEAPGITAEGVVRSVAPELDPVAQMIFAEAEVKSASAGLQSGLVCRVVPRPRK